MITPCQAQQDYAAAITLLRNAELAPGLTSVDRVLIGNTIREVSLICAGQPQLEICSLRAQYEHFLSSMTAVLGGLRGGAVSPKVLDELTQIVEKGGGSARAPGEPMISSETPGSRAKKRSSPGDSPDPSIRILCVHGVGHQEADAMFEGVWRDSISRGISTWSLARVFEIQFVRYDDLFAAAPLGATGVAEALFKLGASGIIHGIGDLFRKSRGLGGVAESVRWTAGMVAQWAENKRLRAEARERVLDHARRFNPHVVLAHSLGSLLCYDAFVRAGDRGLLSGKTFVSFGSQIGNPFVRSTLGGRIVPLEAARWFHLYNPRDDAFTAPLRLQSPNFEQVDANFDVDGMLDHDAGEYLLHSNTINVVWRSVAAMGKGRGLARGDSADVAGNPKGAAITRPSRTSKPQRRALLVGINDYPNPAERLEGCVNDVFLMSSLLQEAGFQADDIRVVLNERATAKGILERLEWLLEGADEGQDRVFYYSGHGAQIPGYGVGEKVDGRDECLVAYDFDWSRDRAVTDDQFYDLYSQLPYGTRFLTVFDCCHSGGMTREGGARVRGLTPPDDIRHRELKWNVKEKMWVSRDFKETSRATRLIQTERAKAKQTRFGIDGSVAKLGVGAELREQKKEFDAACKAYGHKGPFMPVILQACQETEFSYEYRHGVQSYGAFTYSLGLLLRETETAKKPLTWSQLEGRLRKKLAFLQYDQKPHLVCPGSVRNQPIPWRLK